jgi:NAD(P)H-hydrate epimerase
LNTHPTNLYSAEIVAQLDKAAIESGIPGYTLMRRAGQALFDLILQDYPDAKKILILCGAGNNAGDGYVLATVASRHGMDVQVASMIDPEQLKGDAAQAYIHWSECGSTLSYKKADFSDADIIVDALLGTGLARDVEGDWKKVVDAINQSHLPVISVDVPSGLNANTGAIFGTAVRAQQTLTFIGLKKGLFTGSGKACTGIVSYHDLEVPAEIINSAEHDAELLRLPSQLSLPARQPDSHKGKNGHVLVIGGNYGMAGAVILAARAALRAGAGLVSVVTRPEHLAATIAACPECMAYSSMNGEIPGALLERVDCIAIGCGLGQDAWAQRLLMLAMQMNKPMVIDADALNLLADQEQVPIPDHSVITPHPGEAARLLGESVALVQQDRFAAARALQKKFSTRVVLKGSGSIVQQAQKPGVCAFGNQAMATAGMGDVLSGVIAACISQALCEYVNQGYDLDQAINVAVCLHGRAGDLAAQGDERGLMASDVIEHIREAARNDVC